MYWKRIKTLHQFADYINDYDGWPPNTIQIIERNGWTEIIDRYKICHDGKNLLTFVNENDVAVIELNND